MKYYILFYFLIINLLSFATMGIDKLKAKQGRRRIRERTLFLLAIFGGSIGSILGMRLFHHKTRHRSFAFGMPTILLLQCAIATIIFWKFYI